MDNKKNYAEVLEMVGMKWDIMTVIQWFIEDSWNFYLRRKMVWRTQGWPQARGQFLYYTEMQSESSVTDWNCRKVRDIWNYNWRCCFVWLRLVKKIWQIHKKMLFIILLCSLILPLYYLCRSSFWWQRLFYWAGCISWHVCKSEWTT